MRLFHLACLLVLALTACSDDANDRGVGAVCTTNNDCTEEGQSCLTQFKGGYCGLSGCVRDADCPEGSACITEDDRVNYCFLVCADKPDCNANRPVEDEASCVSSLPFVEGAQGRKVCRPSMGS
jgi:hypothetical protein